MDSMSPADVVALSNGSGFGGFEGLIYLAVIASMFGGGWGNWGGGNNGNAIQADVNRGFDNQNLMAQTRDIMSTSTANASNAIDAIKDGNAALIREFGTVESALTALGGTQQECCCNILRAIDSVNFNGAVNTAAINANTTAQVQKVLDAIVGNRMADMQQQINQLQLDKATAGVLRYPNSWSYGAGPFPPLYGGFGNV